MIPTDFTPPADHEPVHLTEAQIDRIVDRAVDKVFDRIYTEVGKSVVRKITWAIGIVVTGLALWLYGKGIK
jgi:tetrahydromethanopterin S-methyltransferase subunit G